jgi:ABC-type multidrug transport system ATPase subunit
MRRRLDIAPSFIGLPAALFLDAPANVLDPHSRKRDER